jgi:hypothetical protein
MLPNMDTTPPVTTTFEPCGVFVADEDTPVCTECGWLEIEHDSAPRAANKPRKLAA